MTELDGSLLITSPTRAGNALGRALALADLGTEVVSDVAVMAPDDGPTWSAASRWHHPVRRLKRSSVVPNGLASRRVDWVWMVKPLGKSQLIANAVMNENPGAKFILDLDDDDEALSREYAGASLLNRLRLHPFRQLNPSRIARTRETVLARADAVTVASRAVADRLVPGREVVRIPHPRAIAESDRERRRPADGTKHIGFFGTVRGHKGLDSLISILDRDPAVWLHIFAGSQIQSVKDPQRVIEHPVDESYEQLFSAVDAVVLPQRDSSGGDVQLPAKLLDAMRLGVPVITSRTTAIVEIAGDTVFYVEDWSNPDRVSAALERCLQIGENMGATSRELFEREYALEVSIPVLRGLLHRLSDRVGEPDAN